MRMEKLTELFDKDGNLPGVVLSAEAWDAVRGQVEKALDLGAAPRENPEPLPTGRRSSISGGLSATPWTRTGCSACGPRRRLAADRAAQVRLLAATLAGW
jgi:hypothetical protein